MKSELETVPVLIKVDTTSGVTKTSEAPESNMKFSFKTPLISRGTEYVPS